MPMYDLFTVLSMPGALAGTPAQAHVSEQSFSRSAVPDVQAYLVTSEAQKHGGKNEHHVALLQVQVHKEGMIHRKLKVKGLTEAGADRMTFYNEESKFQVTVQDYYKERYNYE